MEGGGLWGEKKKESSVNVNKAYLCVNATTVSRKLSNCKL
jgi:hypothetical protein